MLGIKFKQSLSFKIIFIIIITCITITSIIGLTVYQRVSSTIINEKIAISKVESSNALNVAQSQFNIARFKGDAGLNKAVEDFITKSREDGLISGRETVLLPISSSNKKISIFQTVPSLLVLNSIPREFRDEVRNSKDVLEKKVTIYYSNGKNYPGFLIGGKLNIPKSGAYEIYYLFKLNAQYQSIATIAWTLILAGCLLVFLIALSTRFLLRRVIAPVQQAAKVAEMFTQ